MCVCIYISFIGVPLESNAVGLSNRDLTNPAVHPFPLLRFHYNTPWERVDGSLWCGAFFTVAASTMTHCLESESRWLSRPFFFLRLYQFWSFFFLHTSRPYKISSSSSLLDSVGINNGKQLFSSGSHSYDLLHCIWPTAVLHRRLYPFSFFIFIKVIDS